jgi:hypothetical protein
MKLLINGFDLGILDLSVLFYIVWIMLLTIDYSVTLPPTIKDLENYELSQTFATPDSFMPIWSYPTLKNPTCSLISANPFNA